MSGKIKNKIMSEIKDDKIRMKSRWIFIAKSIGLKSGLALSVIMFILLVNSFMYYVKANNLFISLHYGNSTWQEVLHSLPYDVIIVIILLIVFLNFIIKKFDFSYSHPFVVIFTIIILGSILVSSLLFASNFNHVFRAQLEKSEINIPYVSHFYINRCCGDDICR